LPVIKLRQPAWLSDGAVAAAGSLAVERLVSEAGLAAASLCDAMSADA
jgi:hypothetical protein